MRGKKLFRCCNGFPEHNGDGDKDKRHRLIRRHEVELRKFFGKTFKASPLSIRAVTILGRMGLTDDDLGKASFSYFLHRNKEQGK